jgi:hypothetical protein
MPDGTSCRAFALRTSSRCWGHSPARLAVRRAELERERARLYELIGSLGERLAPIERELAWVIAHAWPDDPALRAELDQLEATDPALRSLACKVDQALERLKGQS